MKLAFVGGGSYQWGYKLIRDMLVTKGLDGGHITLVDIDPNAARDVLRAAKAIQRQAKTHWTFEIEPNLNKGLKGADFVLVCISTGGFDAMEHDLNIPWAYGVHHTVGDSVGPGGMNRALRNIPVVVDIMERVERICPSAWVLNVTNPMATLTRAMSIVRGNQRVVGLCHEVYGAAHYIHQLLRVDHLDPAFDITVAGVNHGAYVLDAAVAGRSLLPDIMKASASKAFMMKRWLGSDPTSREKAEAFWQRSFMRRTLTRQLGYLPSQGDRHTVENLGQFTRDTATYRGIWGGHYTTIQDRREGWLPRMKQSTLDVARGKEKVKLACSAEPVAPIMDAIVSGTDYKLKAGNLANMGQIANLPTDVCVETPCLVCGGAIRPVSVGDLPLPLMGIVAGEVARQELTVQAALEGDRNKALQALFSDPMIECAAATELMLGEMMEATAQWLPQFFPKGKAGAPSRATLKARREAKARLQAGISRTPAGEGAAIPAEILGQG